MGGDGRNSGEVTEEMTTDMTSRTGEQHSLLRRHSASLDRWHLDVGELPSIRFGGIVGDTRATPDQCRVDPSVFKRVPDKRGDRKQMVTRLTDGDIGSLSSRRAVVAIIEQYEVHRADWHREL